MFTRKSLPALALASAMLPALSGCDAMFYDDIADGYIQPSVGLYMGNGYIEPSLGLNISYPFGTGFYDGFGYPWGLAPRPRPRPPMMYPPERPQPPTVTPTPSAPPQHAIPPLRPGAPNGRH